MHVFKYAAIFIGLVALTYGYNEYAKPNSQTLNSDSDVITLQLDNGETRILSTDDSHSIVNKQGAIVGKKERNKLDYRGASTDDKLTYNTLKIPYGKRFEITLSDGTMVHLNAGSSIKYPTRFLNGNKREVFLNGEAYFDVSADKDHPFIVTTSEMDVTVLGTRFNVSAYQEDAYFNTVLVEGAVSLSSSENENDSHKTIDLTPGHKAEWNIDKGTAKIENVDTDIYTSWISGRLVLKNLAFNTILTKLERHYNIEIKNNYPELDNEIFTASFDIETITEVLDSFSENKKFNYTVNNQTIIINKP